MSREKKDTEHQQPKDAFDQQRREFLRKSMYVAYATPVIMSVLVEKASAQLSAGGPGSVACNKPNVCRTNPVCWERFPDDCPPR